MGRDERGKQKTSKNYKAWMGWTEEYGVNDRTQNWRIRNGKEEEEG